MTGFPEACITVYSAVTHDFGHHFTYSHCGLILLQPLAIKSFHKTIARFLPILLRLLRRGMPLSSILPLSTNTLGFISQLSQSYLNLSIHFPCGSFSQPSRFITGLSSTNILVYISRDLLDSFLTLTCSNFSMIRSNSLFI